MHENRVFSLSARSCFGRSFPLNHVTPSLTQTHSQSRMAGTATSPTDFGHTVCHTLHTTMSHPVYTATPPAPQRRSPLACGSVLSSPQFGRTHANTRFTDATQKRMGKRHHRRTLPTRSSQVSCKCQNLVKSLANGKTWSSLSQVLELKPEHKC